MRFDWDDANRHHIARHKVTSAEAEQVIHNDPYDFDQHKVDGEERYSQLGETDAGRILLIVATWRLDVVRIVTAWDATASLKRRYLA